MTGVSLLSLLLTFTLQSASPLTLDIRVFRGATDVTRETRVGIFDAGTRANGRPAPLTGSGERRLTLPGGVYDVQLLQEREGAVVGIAWSTLRLLADYPRDGQPQLEVLNFDKTYGALQLRPRDRSATLAWTARLVRPDGTEVARGTAGQGYQLLVAPAGTYDVVISRPGQPLRLHGVTIAANLTEVRTF